jgi:hypothetical protein
MEARARSWLDSNLIYASIRLEVGQRDVMLVEPRSHRMTLHQGSIEIAYIVLPLLALQWLFASKIDTEGR